ncbi:MAG TPA: Stk1 family PASTA domain-containing Ser/Thr kinase [Dermatophilaceae bacterium]|nr:Stk1 family PASTA domain-containing Ser/Thr kinase [Dermatophilaceae bacterium]
MSVAEPRLLAGRYQVGDLIGRGGMAEVHAGWDTRLGRQVAIKILRSELARDTSFLLRFRREAQSAAALNHPSIVAVFDSGEQILTESGGAELAVPFIVMERVHGRTLRDVLHGDGPLAPRQAARIMADTLRALGYSHDHGIVHRDVKPANVMVTGAGDVKVMDFGIARAVADTAATMTNTAVVIGTAQYLSPEQAQGHDVDARSDLYSAGCLLFELLTGRTPFVGDSPVAVAYQHVGQSPEAPSHYRPDVPPELDAVNLFALAKLRQDRYQSAEQFATDLDAVVLGNPISDAARAVLPGRDNTDNTGGATGAAERRGDGMPPRLAADLEGRRPVAQDPETGTLPVITRPSRRRRLLRIGAPLLLLIAGLVTIGVLVASGVIGPVRDISVPGVTQLSEAAATSQLSREGFAAEVRREPSDVPVGTVVTQEPAGGTLRPPGSKVVLRISTGPRIVALPDLRNYDQASARQRLADLRLLVGAITQVDSHEVTSGNVVLSEPKAGTRIREGSSVDLVLSNGRIKVPNVVGMSESEARLALNKVGLQTRVTLVDSGRAIGTVVSETYRDQRVAVGTRIDLRVSKGRPAPPPTTTVTKTITPSPSETTTPPSPGAP